MSEDRTVSTVTITEHGCPLDFIVSDVEFSELRVIEAPTEDIFDPETGGPDGPVKERMVTGKRRFQLWMNKATFDSLVDDLSDIIEARKTTLDGVREADESIVDHWSKIRRMK